MQMALQAIHQCRHLKWNICTSYLVGVSKQDQIQEPVRIKWNSVLGLLWWWAFEHCKLLQNNKVRTLWLGKDGTGSWYETIQGDCGLDVSDGRSYRLRWQLCINLYSITSFCWKVVLMMVDSDEDGDDDNDEGDSKVRMWWTVSSQFFRLLACLK